jgi:membrane protease YdiL (CAAX protease family)
MLSAKPWRADTVILFCTAQFVCLCIGMITAGLLQKFGVTGFKETEDAGNILVGTLCFQGATWVLIPIFLRQNQMGVREALGLRGPKLNQALLMAVLFVVVILPVALLLQTASVHVLTRLGWPPVNETAVTLMTGAKSLGLQLYLGLFAVVLAPRLAWFGVSALFALIHFDAAIFVPLFVLALGLTWLYETTDNLIAPIVAHSLFNTTNLVLLYLTDEFSRTLPAQP